MYRLLCAVLVGLVTVCAAADTVHADTTVDWPNWRGENRDGIAVGVPWNPRSLESSDSVRWETDIGTGYSSVAVWSGRVYAMGNSGREDTVYCLDEDTGRELWSYSYACGSGSYPGPRATPAVDGDRVYTLSREGHLYCFSADNGRVLWQVHLADDLRIMPPSWDFAGSPLVAGDLIVVNAGKAGTAFDKLTGNVEWDSGRSRGGYASPVPYEHDGTSAVVIFGRNEVYGVRLRDGRELWSYPWRTGSDVNAADPLVRDGKVFVSSAYNKGCGVIDFMSGRRPSLVWSSDVFESHFSSFVEIDGYIYGNSGDARMARSGYFRCVDFETGRLQWSERLGFGSLIGVNEHLVLLNSYGELYVADATPRAYRQVAAVSLPRNQYWSPPAYANGRLYVRNLRGALYCLDAD